MIPTGKELDVFFITSDSASGWGNVKHVKHVKFSGTYLCNIRVSSRKFYMFNMFNTMISLARNGF